MVKIIKTFFDKYNLSLTEKVILHRIKDQTAIAELQGVIDRFIPVCKKWISISCTSRINDAIILLQIYYKKNKPIEKKKVAKKE